MWARDGRELFYVGSGRLVAVEVRSGAVFGHGRPQPLFEVTFSSGSPLTYDVAPDGRFVLIREDTLEPGPTQVNLVQGWFEELKRRAPPR